MYRRAVWVRGASGILLVVVPHLADDGDDGMVAQVLPHAGKFVDHRDAQLAQVVRRADARQHQDLGRGHRAGRQHDLVGLHEEYLPTALHFDADSAIALEYDAPHHHVGPHREVEAVPHLPQKRESRAHAHALGVVHGDGAHAAGVGTVHVRVFRIAGLDAGLDEGILERQPFLAREPPHRYRSLRAVEVVADIHVRFHLAEVRQDVDERPLVVALGGPAVVVLGNAAQQHLPVDGAGSADHLAARRRQHLGLLRRALGPPGPVVRRALGRGVGLVAVLQVVGIMLVLGIVGPRLQQQNRAVRILGQTGGHGAASGSGPNHDHVVFHGLTCV